MLLIYYRKTITFFSHYQTFICLFLPYYNIQYQNRLPITDYSKLLNPEL